MLIQIATFTLAAILLLEVDSRFALLLASGRSYRGYAQQSSVYI